MPVRARARFTAGEAAGPVSIEVRGLRRQYRSDDGPLVVLDGLDWSVDAGEFVAVTGRSGAGKTTLLSILGGLERPEVGEVRVGGTDLSSLGGNALAAYRRTTVGFVFQDFGLITPLSALESSRWRSRRCAARGVSGGRASCSTPWGSPIVPATGPRR